jgi:hypothetical protein
MRASACSFATRSSSSCFRAESLATRSCSFAARPSSFATRSSSICLSASSFATRSSSICLSASSFAMRSSSICLSASSFVFFCRECLFLRGALLQLRFALLLCGRHPPRRAFGVVGDVQVLSFVRHEDPRADRVGAQEGLTRGATVNLTNPFSRTRCSLPARSIVHGKYETRRVNLPPDALELPPKNFLLRSSFILIPRVSRIHARPYLLVNTNFHFAACQATAS